MPIIRAGNQVITHINVFSVSPDKQQQLVDSLTETVNAARGVAQVAGLSRGLWGHPSAHGRMGCSHGTSSARLAMGAHCESVSRSRPVTTS